MRRDSLRVTASLVASTTIGDVVSLYSDLHYSFSSFVIERETEGGTSSTRGDGSTSGNMALGVELRCPKTRLIGVGSMFKFLRMLFRHMNPICYMQTKKYIIFKPASRHACMVSTL